MKLLAVDSNSILNRAYYGVKPLTTREGQFTNGIYGFLNILLKLIEENAPDAVAFAFDLRAPTFRHKMFDGYKAGRKGMPEELAQQVEPLKELLTLMGYPILSLEGYEADDILGTLGERCRAAGDECVIATGDRDSFQLVGGGVTVRLAFTRGGQSGAEVIDEAAIREKYGVSPRQMIEVKALMGDSSDNIPGVAGIGEKTALALIQQFGTLDGVYERIDDPAIRKGVREKLLRDRETAYKSRALAEINCAAPLSQTLGELYPKPRQDGPLYALLDRLELRSVISRLGLSPGETAGSNAAPAASKPALPAAVNDLDAAKALLGGTDPVSALLEYSGKQPCRAALAGLSAAALFEAGAPGWDDFLGALSRCAAPLSLTDSKEWYRSRFLTDPDGQPTLAAFDPVLAGYLLSPLSSGYSLESLCAGRNLDPPALSLPEGISPEMSALAQRAAVLPALTAALSAELEEKGMKWLLEEIEIPLARVLASMEALGFSLDEQGLTDYGRELDTDLAELTARIYFLSGGEFNINSPKQLGEVLFDRLGLPARKKTKSGFSTDADTLDGLRKYHPIIDDILSYRKLAKLKSTYVDGLLAQVDSDHRVRSVFRQTETRTGRISSTEPNLQNIPVRTERGSQLRRFFYAPAGRLLVDADYSQIELRVLAHIADDPAMIEAFVHNLDIHTRTAAQVFDMPEEFVTPQMRSSAKAVNFGIVYGIGAYSLSQDIGVSVAEADRYIKSYLANYQGVRRYMQESVSFGAEHGYVQTMFGRRRPLPELAASNRVTHAFGERVAMNTPIQGTAADIIKLAMVRVYDRLRAEGMKARLILQVHDELIVEAPEEEAEQAAKLLTEEMERVVSLKVPLLAEAKTGRNWLEAK